MFLIWLPSNHKSARYLWEVSLTSLSLYSLHWKVWGLNRMLSDASWSSNRLLLDPTWFWSHQLFPRLCSHYCVRSLYSQTLLCRWFHIAFKLRSYGNTWKCSDLFKWNSCKYSPTKRTSPPGSTSIPLFFIIVGLTQFYKKFTFKQQIA